MELRLIAFGIAKDIIESNSGSITVPDNSTISDVKQELIRKYPRFSELRSLKFAINEEYQGDEYTLNPNDEIVIIPPVSGG